MKRTLILVALLCVLSLPAIAQTNIPQSKPVIVKQHKKHRFLKVFIVPGKFVLAGLLRVFVDSKGEPY